MRAFLIAAVLAGGIAGGAGLALAQEAPARITFPIAELDGCASKAECKAYCDDPAHTQACIDFAESRGMMSKDAAHKARVVITQTGPGGCRGQECRTYCSDPANRQECMAFAEKQGFAPPRPPRVDNEDHQVSPDKEKEVLQKIAVSGGPGGCKTKEACMAYCDDSAHIEECLSFAEIHGLMTPDQAQKARKMMQMEGPGGCRGQACRDYCEDPSHMKECIEFAKKSGLMSTEEAERATKMQAMMEAGGPGGCKTPDSCHAYCSDEANRQECMDVARKQGFDVPPDAQRGDMSPDSMGEYGAPPCSTEAECRALHESRRSESGAPPCTTEEECRALHEKYQNASNTPPCRTEEECRALHESRRGESHRPPCTTEEECRALYETYRTGVPEGYNQEHRQQEGYQPPPDMQYPTPANGPAAVWAAVLRFFGLR